MQGLAAHEVISALCAICVCTVRSIGLSMSRLLSHSWIANVEQCACAHEAHLMQRSACELVIGEYVEGIHFAQ